MELGVAIAANEALDEVRGGAATVSCVFTGKQRTLEAGTVVMVASRLPRAGMPGVAGAAVIGDALAPAAIAHAVYAGRRYAEEFDAPKRSFLELPFKREVTALSVAS